MTVEIYKTKFDTVFKILPKRYLDTRGYFEETWNKSKLQEHGIFVDFVQDNLSFSNKKGIFRGLHAQVPPFEQCKLVRCGIGKIMDVVVDIRKGSPTYGLWQTYELSDENGYQLFVPAGYLHGFLTLSETTMVQYKCSNHYNLAAEINVDWKSIDIDWRENKICETSSKDTNSLAFDKLKSPFDWRAEV